MTTLLASAPPGAPPQPLTFTRTGQGTLFYTARLRYAVDRSSNRARPGDPHRAQLRALRRDRRPVRPATSVQGRRSHARHVDAPPDQGAAIRRRHRSAARRLRAGRVVVRDVGGGARHAAGPQGEVSDDWFTWWQRGGFDHVERHDDRVQLFATRLSEGRHSSPTSCARRPPARSARRRRTPRRCTSPRCSGEPRRRSSRSRSSAAR